MFVISLNIHAGGNVLIESKLEL